MAISSPMSRRAWYRSLYWRIGAGFVVFLALVAAAQAGALVWLTSRIDYGPPSPSATRVVADELSAALAQDPKLDLAQFFRQHYEERVPMVAVMRDGRVVSSNGVTPPDDLVREARIRLSAAERGFGPGAPRRFGGPGRGFGPGGPAGEPGARGPMPDFPGGPGMFDGGRGGGGGGSGGGPPVSGLLGRGLLGGGGGGTPAGG